MPPQPGMFPIPYASTHKPRTNNRMPEVLDLSYQHQHHPHPHHHHNVNYSIGGSGSRAHGNSMDDGRKEKKRKEIAGKVGKEISDRRDDGRHFAEKIASLHNTAVQLSLKPEAVPMYMLRLYTLSLKRSAVLAQLDIEEKHTLESVQTAYEEERERVEDEWKRGRDKVRERLVEGIEERRRRARDEKEGEGTVGDASLDPQSRPHITRKLRNKLGTSPPPTPLGAPNTVLTNGLGLNNGTLPITCGPVTNPHSLAVDELPSPFPLPLTSTSLPSGHGGGTGAGGVGAGGIGSNGRRRAKGVGTFQSQAGVGGLGKSLAVLVAIKESEIEADLGEIRKGNKRRRSTAMTVGKSNV